MRTAGNLLLDVINDILDFSKIDKTVDKNYLGDSGRLRQILVNLVGNAVKFTKQGEIFVSVTPAPESLSQNHSLDKQTLLFTVRDSGIGISSENQKNIFKSFTQADGTNTRQYGGTGLGLSISSQLIELMGGTIWVESAVGQETTFFSRLSWRKLMKPIHS
nr:hypothetical protein [Desulfobulbaceae bacterium]